jgi:hypothetical protein
MLLLQLVGHIMQPQVLLVGVHLAKCGCGSQELTEKFLVSLFPVFSDNLT